MSSTTDLVVRLIEISSADNEITLSIAFKTISGHDVEDSVRTVSIVGIVAASQNFEIIDVFGINLRPQIGGDVRVGNRDTVNQPFNLMASAHVQHVVGHVRSRHVISDHLQAVRAICPRGYLDVFTVYHRCRRHSIHRRLHWDS